MSVRSSLFHRVLLPPLAADRESPDALRRRADVRFVLILVSLAVDAFILLGLRDPTIVNLRVLDAFGAINVPLLTLDALVSLAILRDPARLRLERWAPPILWACIVIEMFTTTVWVQVTGTVSSYFLLVGPIFVFSYRLVIGYRAGLVAWFSLVACHVTAFALEELHVLRPAALFVSDPGAIYSSPMFRLAALASIQSVYCSTFFLSNFVSNSLREKDEALDEAREDVERLMEEGQPGRLSGQTLAGKYELGELLGRGGMGEVYEARAIVSDVVPAGDLVAIKVLYAHLSNHRSALARFRREAVATRELPSARVACVHELGSDGETLHFMVMELLAGEDLGALLRRRGKLAADEVLALAAQLAEVLDAAHAAGIVHRDVKPPNVFIGAHDGAMDVRLLDFGISRLGEGGRETQLTQTLAVLGSPGYLAPEQVDDGYGEIGPATDVFALGCVLYRALTGHAAFRSRTPAGALYETVHHHPPPVTTASPELHADVDHVLALALAKPAKERYASAGELARDLRLACEGALPPAARARAEAAGRWGPARDATLTSAG